MTRVAFIGLGVMGQPMALNLVRSGHDVTVFNRTAARLAPVVDAGARAATSVADAVSAVEMVITILSDGQAVSEVARAAGGLFEAAKPGTLWVDMSTIEPSVAVALAAEGAARGLRCLDAPVSGGEAGAIDGSLSIMVGGERQDVERARPVLEVLGSTVGHVGPHGAGQVVKAANQLLVAGIIELVAEALVFLEVQGVDMEVAVGVLAGGLAGNRVLDRKAARMLARDFRPGFRSALHHKDLGIFTAEARRCGVASPLGAVVAQLMGALVARGDGDLDHGALLQLVDELAGRATQPPADHR